MATTAATRPSTAAAWIAQKPPMLEPRSATAGARSRMRSSMTIASSNAEGPKSPSERPWPRASEVGGCDLIELAREFGTPAYVYAEDDIRARTRAYVDAFRARTEHFEVVYASKAFPCTAAYRLLAGEGLACDVASGGELHLALRG